MTGAVLAHLAAFAGVSVLVVAGAILERAAAAIRRAVRGRSS